MVILLELRLEPAERRPVVDVSESLLRVDPRRRRGLSAVCSAVGDEEAPPGDADTAIGLGLCSAGDRVCVGEGGPRLPSIGFGSSYIAISSMASSSELPGPSPSLMSSSESDREDT